MKTIEEFNLHNITLIDDYLEDQMDAEQRWRFERQVEADPELQRDFELYREALSDRRFKNRRTKNKRFSLQDYFYGFGEGVHLERKRAIGQQIVSSGVFGMAMAVLVLGLTAFLLAYVIS